MKASETTYVIKAMGYEGWFEFSRTGDYDEACEDLDLAKAYYDEAKLERIANGK